MRINISRCDRAAVLKALFDNARKQGMTFLLAPEPMTIQQARDLLSLPGSGSFDYVKGRVIKCRVTDDVMDVSLYDRDNGQGAALVALLAAGLDCLEERE